MRVALVPLVALAPLLAGCAGPADEAGYGFSGRFVDGTPMAKREEVFHRLRAEGASLATTDDLPPSSFGAYDLRPDACEALWAWVRTLPFVEPRTPCRPFAIE